MASRLPLHDQDSERISLDSLDQPLLTDETEDKDGLPGITSGKSKGRWTRFSLLGAAFSWRNDRSECKAQSSFSSSSSSQDWTPIDSHSHSFIPAVEGLRGIAVTFTVTCHSLSGPPVLRDSMGSSGVTIFFVLSGFLITAVLIRLKVGVLAHYYGLDSRTDIGLQSKSQNRWSLLYRFYSDRFFRLTPGLFFMMGIIYIYHFIYKASIMDQVNRFTLLGIVYLSNWPELWWPNAVGPFPHLWSLACEEQFYIIWSSIFTIVLARSYRIRVLMLSLVILISLGVRAYVSMYFGALHDMHYLYALTPNIYKMLLGSSLRLVPLPLWMQRSFTSYLGLLGLATTVYLTSLPPPHYENWAPGWVFYARPVMMWADFLTAVSTALILCGVSGHQSGNMLLELAPIRFVGRVSYAWYLWQIPILFLTNNTYKAWPAFADSAAAFVMASFSTVYVEEPINQWYKARREAKSKSDLRSAVAEETSIPMVSQRV